MRFASALLFLSLHCAIAAAEPPTLTRLFPAGAQRGSAFSVEYKGSLGDGDLRFWSSHPSVGWEKSEEQNRLRVTIAADAVPGVTWMRVVNSAGVSATMPFIVGHLPECSEVEPNDLLRDSMRVDPLPQLINGVLEKRGDVDHYRVAVRAGETLVASIYAERELQSEVDASLQLVDENGNVIAQNLDYHGLDPQIAWTADKDRQVVVRVFGFPANPDSTIALAGGENYLYRLQLTTGPFCEGVMPLAVSAIKTTELTAMGWNLDGHGPLEVAPQPPGSATYRFVLDNVPGTFPLPVTEHPIFVLPPGHSDKGPSNITIPAVVCGKISEAGQVDVLEFDAEADTPWQLTLESRRLGYPLDAIVTIEEAASGKRLLEVDDSNRQPDPELQWTAPATGRYRVTIKDVNGIGEAHNLYRLSIARQLADYRATAGGTSFKGKAGEPLEIPIQIERQFGFDQPLVIGLSEAVEGLELTPVISEAGGDTAKEVKLQVLAGSALVTSLRLQVGLATDAGDGAATTAKPVVDAATGIEEIWITIR
jgi:hypothetical protein